MALGLVTALLFAPHAVLDAMSGGFVVGAHDRRQRTNNIVNAISQSLIVTK